ncbi:MAG: DUF3119 family protein [Leptolyngbyaceae cyanobacterium MAG.088]|nr:DUF3119 family protein [Leptolyngbyaceae cyanobacterium MAG.088]
MTTLFSPPTVVTTLRPDYRLSLSVLFIGLCVGAIKALAGVIIVLLGLFLVVQTTVIRLTFTETELQVCRGTTVLRRFPYADWQVWTIFWSPVPILFYFREVKSIHFLPMLFNPAELMTQLKQHCKTVKLGV